MPELNSAVYGDNALPVHYFVVTNTGNVAIENIVVDVMDIYVGDHSPGVLKTFNIRILEPGGSEEFNAHVKLDRSSSAGVYGMVIREYWKSQVVRICCDGPDGKTVSQLYGAQWKKNADRPEYYHRISACFVVTAAYGDQHHPVVCIFREFRDDMLLRCNFGAKLVEAYNKYGPVAASAIQGSPGLGFIARCILMPMAVVIASSRVCVGFMRMLAKPFVKRSD